MAWHKMKGNKSTAVPRHFVFLDCEAEESLIDGNENERVQTLRLGVAIYVRYEKNKIVQREKIRFRTADQFWKIVEKHLGPKTAVWIVAHNAPYDLKLVRFFEYVENGHCDFDVPTIQISEQKSGRPQNGKRDPLIVLDDPPTILSLRHESGGTIVVVDTLNYWRMSLSAMGKSVGIEKGDFPGFDGDDETMFTYCENDAEIIALSMMNLIQWWKEGDYGMFRFTSPSLAMAAYRHSFTKNVEITFHDEMETKGLERASYTGGETEVYRYGTVDSPVIQLDVTSLYPHVMRVNYFPCLLVDWSNFDRPKHPPDNYPRKAMIGHVRLKTDQTFPVRHQGSTLHVTGEFTTTLAGPELFRAEQSGAIVEWLSWSFYRLAPLFVDFVDHFWALRLEYQKSGDKMKETFVKLLLNSLYGKFGQMMPGWVFDERTPPTVRWGEFSHYNLESKELRKLLSLNNHVFRQAFRQPSEKSFHAIASFVTAHAREHMRDLRATAGHGEYYYQATDSLCVSHLGFKRLVQSGEIAEQTLGKLKEEWRSKSGVFLGNNWYSLDEKIIEGGRKKESPSTADGGWQELHFQHFKQMLETTTATGVLVNKIIKHRSTDFRRGNVTAAGIVEPFIFPQEAP